ncbi:NMD3-like protein [Mya arenaria]|uniref:NMD3-like protein n=1 Tax=Mya arenaria TaxID=6604 RepID=A0ABY7F8I4_MYAAR|nr:NMD3-like protein [Mya arenaria]
MLLDYLAAFIRLIFHLLPILSFSRHVCAQELISHDVRNNTFNYKHTFSVTIVPICKDNIVCLPKKLASSLGNINPICVCFKVTQTVHLIDPNTLQVAEVSGPVYWRSPFVSLCSPRQLIEYMVMDVQYVNDRDKPVIRGQVSQKHVLADLWVSRMSDLGVNDQQFFCKTHIGHLLNVGDTVLGFDMGNANLNNDHIEKLKAENLPDVVIVKKVFGDKKKHSDKVPVDTDDTDDEGVPQISLQEMLDDLHIGDDATVIYFFLKMYLL